MPVLRTKTSRMWLPDALRGLALLNMLAYHAMYDWVYVFGHESSWYNIWAPGCHVWQQYICWSFILLSGFSFPLAKRPAKNGLIVAGCAAVLTFVTAALMPSEAIWFGVLHLNAAAVLLTCLVYPLLQRLPAEIVMATAESSYAGISENELLRQTAAAISVEVCGRLGLPMPPDAFQTLEGMRDHIPDGEERRTLEKVREMAVTFGDAVCKRLKLERGQPAPQREER